VKTPSIRAYRTDLQSKHLGLILAASRKDCYLHDLLRLCVSIISISGF